MSLENIVAAVVLDVDSKADTLQYRKALDVTRIYGVDLVDGGPTSPSLTSA